MDFLFLVGLTDCQMPLPCAAIAGWCFTMNKTQLKSVSQQWNCRDAHFVQIIYQYLFPLDCWCRTFAISSYSQNAIFCFFFLLRIQCSTAAFTLRMNRMVIYSAMRIQCNLYKIKIEKIWKNSYSNSDARMQLAIWNRVDLCWTLDRIADKCVADAFTLLNSISKTAVSVAPVCVCGCSADCFSFEFELALNLLLISTISSRWLWLTVVRVALEPIDSLGGITQP